MELLKPPDRLRTTGDTSKNWQLFKQKLELYLTVVQPHDNPLSDAAKTAMLLSLAGEDAIEIYNNFAFQEGENNQNYATVVKKFDDYWDAQRNEVYERYIYRKRTQSEGETFEHFWRDGKKQARFCNFGTLTDSMIRDQIIIGISSDSLRAKLLRDNQLTLANAEQLCKASEAAAIQNEAWATKEMQVHPVNQSVPQKKQYDSTALEKVKCSSRCGRLHKPRRCPAYGKTCRACQEKNHFAACCRRTEQVGELKSDDEDFDVPDIGVNSVGR